jgi:hypothetical protein
MNRKMLVAPTAALVLGLCALLLSSPAAVAAGRSTATVITGTTKIGGYHVGAGYTQARRIFGPQYSSTGAAATCTARWADGVSITWHRTGSSTNWSKTCVKFGFARVGKPKVAGPAWRTNKGLRVGALTSQLRTLYPSAASKRSGIYTVWTLQKTPTLSLEAWVKNGKVAYFRLATG